MNNGLTFSGKVKLVGFRELNKVISELPSGSYTGEPWVVSNATKQKSNAATSLAADCLIIGGKTPKLQNMYHIKPLDITPKKVAQQIDEELNELSQITGEPVDVMLTGGQFSPPIQQLIRKIKKNTQSKERWETAKELYDSLMNRFVKGSYTSKVSSIAGRKSGHGGYTGLASLENDPNWYLNVSRGANPYRSPSIQAESELQKIFEKVDY